MTSIRIETLIPAKNDRQRAFADELPVPALDKAGGVPTVAAFETPCRLPRVDGGRHTFVDTSHRRVHVAQGETSCATRSFLTPERVNRC